MIVDSSHPQSPDKEKSIIGILIPTRNRVDFLKEALSSALCQTRDALRIVVIDNASTDETRDYMSSLEDPRVSYIINETDIGMARSIDKGIDALPAEVEWSTVLCDDDRLDKGFVEAMAHAIEVRSVHAIANGHRVFIDTAGNRIGASLPDPEEESATEYLRNRLRLRRQTFLTGILFRREVFKDIGGYPKFPTGLTTDDALIFALALSDRLVHVHDAIAYVRLHGGAESMSPTNVPAILETTQTFEDYCVRFASERIGNIDNREKFLKNVVRRYVIQINSALYLLQLHGIPSRMTPEIKDDLGLISSCVLENPSLFCCRVFIAAYCYRHYGFRPEKFTVYRFLWFLAGPRWGARWRLYRLHRRAED